jgi:protocatechuate 3,4-dioxygenase beta subunit
VYIHTGDKRGSFDKNFQGFGRFLTGSKGEYYFRTIKPVPYGNRPAHIHYAVYKNNQRVLTTQCYVKGDKRLEKDKPLKRSGALEGNPLVVDFTPIKNSKLGDLSAHFDIVIA